jgi:glycosyltransferase involved in cell wall biosynthesis
LSEVTLAAVIPLFNKAEAIESTILSVLRQTRLPDELIIVDDGSTDGSAAKAEELLSVAGTQVRWRILSQQNAGVSAARNRGVEAASTTYVAFLDADDEWLPECAAEFERLALAFPSAAILSVRLAKRAVDHTLVPEPSALAPNFFGIVARPLRVYRNGYGILSSSSVALRRDVFQAAGGFPLAARRGEDVHLWLRLLMTEDFAHSARPLSVWRDHYSSAVARSGAIPAHLAYFLGSAEGRGQLSNRALSAFLESNLLVQIIMIRLVGDERVARELAELARFCSIATRLKARAVLLLPLWFVRAATSGWRKAIRSRGARQSSSRA